MYRLYLMDGLIFYKEPKITGTDKSDMDLSTFTLIITYLSISDWNKLNEKEPLPLTFIEKLMSQFISEEDAYSIICGYGLLHSQFELQKTITPFPCFKIQGNVNIIELSSMSVALGSSKEIGRAHV